MQYERHMVDVPGATLYVRTAGPEDGYPLVLLHGWPDTGAGWDLVARRLASTYRLIIPDNRGFGRSSMPEKTDDYRMHVVLGDLVALLGWTGAERAGVVGHDFGGAVAWQAGTFLAGLVERIVVLCSPHPLNWKAKAGASVDQMRRSFYAWLMNVGEPGERLLAASDFQTLLDFAYGPVLSEERREALRANWAEPGRFHAMAEWYRAAYRPELLDPGVPLELPPVRVPTRYVHGLQDWAFIPDLADGNEAFVDAEYDQIVVEDGTHWLMLTHPDLVASAIRSWIG